VADQVPRLAVSRDHGFVARSTVMDADDIGRAITRIAHEVIEHNHGLDSVAVVGLQRGGVWLADRIAVALETFGGQQVERGSLDVSMYRDDIGLRPVTPQATDIAFDVTGRHVVLVDDVLFTGRTIRSALNALGELGRPRTVQLAVLVDRGHRELPIRPDYVGKNLPTRRDETVRVNPDGVAIGDVNR
jgi:pyrimidine operon attenuation protein/uracil phosphoribosyltransferase